MSEEILQMFKGRGCKVSKVMSGGLLINDVVCPNGMGILFETAQKDGPPMGVEVSFPVPYKAEYTRGFWRGAGITPLLQEGAGLRCQPMAKHFIQRKTPQGMDYTMTKFICGDRKPEEITKIYQWASQTANLTNSLLQSRTYGGLKAPGEEDWL